MRSVVVRYEDIPSLMAALASDIRRVLAPADPAISEGEWVLVTFEVGSRKRATAAPARVVICASTGAIELSFEARDWDRLSQFAYAKSEHFRAAPQVPSSARVPAATAVDDEALDVSAPVSSHGSRFPTGSRVLVVDTDPDALELRKVLEPLGFVVDITHRIDDAAELIHRRSYDAVVVDETSDRASTHAFVAKLRRAPLTKNMPILVVASQASSRSAIEAFASGGDDFLTKPIRIPEYAARVVTLIRESVPASQKRPPAEEP